MELFSLFLHVVSFEYICIDYLIEGKIILGNNLLLKVINVSCLPLPRYSALKLFGRPPWDHPSRECCCCEFVNGLFTRHQGGWMFHTGTAVFAYARHRAKDPRYDEQHEVLKCLVAFAGGDGAVEMALFFSGAYRIRHY